MSMEILNTYCVERVLSFLSMQNFPIFSKVFPQQQDAVHLYYRKLRVINLDRMTLRDIDVFIENMKLCTNVIELKRTRNYTGDMPPLALNNIVRHCAALETLDIPGIQINPEKAIFLRSCDNLKSLSVVIRTTSQEYPLRGLFSDKTQLKNLCISGGYMDETRISIVSFLEAVVETQSSLKFFKLKICFGEENILKRLFSKNPDLETVILEMADMTGDCLRCLPKNIKRLSLKSCFNLDSELLIHCLKSWKLESLCVDSLNRRLDFLEELGAAALTLQHLDMSCGDRSLRFLGCLQELKQLKSLRLSGLKGNLNEQFRRITENCVNLERLKISGDPVVFNEEFLGLIATLPKLKEIKIRGSHRSPIPDYTASMRRLSASQSLTSATLLFSGGFTNEHVLALISGSNILTKLELTGYDLTAELVPEIEKILEQQNRTNTLNLTFKLVPFSAQQIPEENRHPLLKINFAS